MVSLITATSGAGAVDVRARLTEVVDLNNKAAPDHEESADDLAGTGINEPEGDQPIEDMRAEWHPDLQSWIADMSASNGTFVVFGSFQEMGEHRAVLHRRDDEHHLEQDQRHQARHSVQEESHHTGSPASIVAP